MWFIASAEWAAGQNKLGGELQLIALDDELNGCNNPVRIVTPYSLIVLQSAIAVVSSLMSYYVLYHTHVLNILLVHTNIHARDCHVCRVHLLFISLCLYQMYIYVHKHSCMYVCTCMYVYVCTFVHVLCMCMYMYVCMYFVCACMYVYVCMYFVCACMCMYVCACMYVYVCMCVHVCACMCMHVLVCMCVHVCACMYVHVCIRPHGSFHALSLLVNQVFGFLNVFVWFCNIWWVLKDCPAFIAWQEKRSSRSSSNPYQQ